MKQQEAERKEIEALTLRYGEALTREILPTMTGDKWKYYTTAQKVFFLYLIAERHASREIRNQQNTPGDGLERISPGLIGDAVASMIGLSKAI